MDFRNLQMTSLINVKTISNQKRLTGLPIFMRFFMDLRNLPSTSLINGKAISTQTTNIKIMPALCSHLGLAYFHITL